MILLLKRLSIMKISKVTSRCKFSSLSPNHRVRWMQRMQKLTCQPCMAGARKAHKISLMPQWLVHSTTKRTQLLSTVIKASQRMLQAQILSGLTQMIIKMLISHWKLDQSQSNFRLMSVAVTFKTYIDQSLYSSDSRDLKRSEST